MRTNNARFSSQRGSFLLACLIAIIVMTLVSIAMLDIGYKSFESAVKKGEIENTRNVANNEMEFLFYQWANEVDNPSAQTVEQRFQSKVVGSGFVVGDDANMGTPTLSPFLSENASAATISRGIQALPVTALGIVNDQTNAHNPGRGKLGSVSYYRAKVLATTNSPRFGNITVTVGRRFAYQVTSVFNLALFYDGDLEYNPSGKVVISGDVQCNGNIFMGTKSSSATSSLTFSGKVYHYGEFNGAMDSLSGTKYHQFKPADYKSAIFDRNPLDAATPDQTEARGSQVIRTDKKEVYVGNVDVQAVYDQYSALNPSPYPTVNDVTRALIAPPPTDAGGTLLPENEAVKSNRLYNKAGLRIEVQTVAGTDVVRFYDATGADVSGSFTGVVTSIRKDVFDMREKKQVKMTTVDVGALNTVINGSTSLKEKYNGIVYIHDKDAITNTSNAYGVRLANASLVPNVGDQGFVVASNNGVYVQGDFNTTNTPESGETARSAIMSDAMTVLSSNWKDENSKEYVFDPYTGNTLTQTPQELIDAYLPATYDETKRRVANSALTINSAILTGNTKSVSGDDTSGGAQNLIRFLEDWGAVNVTINGSIGQMFTSKYFNAKYLLNGTLSQVYNNPKNRIVSFDRRLAEKPPPGSPKSTTRFYRGEVFNWSPPVVAATP